VIGKSNGICLQGSPPSWMRSRLNYSLIGENSSPAAQGGQDARVPTTNDEPIEFSKTGTEIHSGYAASLDQILMIGNSN
jgi:hypothetical protein